MNKYEFTVFINLHEPRLKKVLLKLLFIVYDKTNAITGFTHPGIYLTLAFSFQS